MDAFHWLQCFKIIVSDLSSSSPTPLPFYFEYCGDDVYVETLLTRFDLCDSSWNVEITLKTNDVY